ncbi:FapA family protein [Gracilibacillus massiliensis]|uniref:FapA family protein n=1 Tax=Gracilibacillus massiliensis TaxID=1564956 RepID=UPI00071DE484|nr:FapA family protein [Gracilibacillus massiliensis]
MSEIQELKEKIDIKISQDRLTATMVVKDIEKLEEVAEEEIESLLDDYKITYGILPWNEMDWKQKLQEKNELIIAEGKKPNNGENGSLVVKQSINNEVSEEEKTNFRDVAKIPMVDENDVLAQLIPPTNGEAGIDVLNQAIKQKKGSIFKCKAGENVSFNESEQTFIATSSGQLSVGDSIINVYPLYEVNSDLSLETGNIDFNGSVTIRGNIPTGYKVKAKGDVAVYGIVEASFIEAGGNVLIREGIAGMEKAVISAGEDLEVGYINQAEVYAGNNLKVRKSIMHSTCVAQGDILCQNGSIIGGSCSAGKVIEVKTIGNMANSKTELAFGISKKTVDRISNLQKKQKELKENKAKLKVLGDQLQQKKDAVGELLAKERIMLLKQRNMYEKTVEQLSEIQEELKELQFEIGNFQDMKLIVKNKAFENVELIFGKYKRVLHQEHKHFQAYLDEKEVTIQPL